MGKLCRAEYRVIGGVRHKLCRGKLHPEGSFVVVDNYYIIKSGKQKGQLYHICKDCVRARNGGEPHVYLNQMWHNFVMELIRRLGFAEAARRLGLSDTWLRELRRRRKTYMRRETARRVIVVLRDVRAANEVRHKDSIKVGAYLRGLPEKKPTDAKHFYVQASDNATEKAREYRQRTGR